MAIPVTTVRAELDVAVPSAESFGETDDHYQSIYQPSVFENAPAGIQVVGRRFREEELLRIGAVVDEAIKNHISS
jgi:amidase